MLIQVLKSKIHNAVITDVKLEYEGSITIDEEIYTKAGLHPYEKVLVVDIENGARFETYIIKGKKGSKIICVNGAAARLVYKGDRVIIMGFGLVNETEIHLDYKPKIIRLDKNNNILPD